MFWVSSCVETARFDAIVVVESMVVDGIMPGLNCLILGFGITYVRSSGDIKIQKNVRACSKSQRNHSRHYRKAASIRMKPFLNITQNSKGFVISRLRFLILILRGSDGRRGSELGGMEVTGGVEVIWKVWE